MKRLLIIIALICGSTLLVQAQTDIPVTDSTLYLVTKTDGGEFYGYILSDDGREILLLTKNIGKIYISKADIARVSKVTDQEILSGRSDGYSDYRVTGPFTTRYSFTTNALPIERGENYALIHLHGPEVHFAMNDNFSLGIMSSWIASPIGVAAKYSFTSESKVKFALGSIVASSGYLLDAQAFGGLHWATVSSGSRKSNLSFSLGYAYADLGQSDLNEIGDKYRFEPWQYDAEQQVIERLEGVDHEWEDRYLFKDFSPSIVLGFAGITPVGKKASFIFDAMLFLGEGADVRYPSTVTVPNVTYYKPMDGQVTEDVTVGVGEVYTTGTRQTLILMPAMRFHQSHTKAFQVSLSGVVLIDEKDGVSTFPVPMVSWLRQF